MFAHNPIKTIQNTPASAEGNLAAHELNPKIEKLAICNQWINAGLSYLGASSNQGETQSPRDSISREASAKAPSSISVNGAEPKPRKMRLQTAATMVIGRHQVKFSCIFL